MDDCSSVPVLVTERLVLRAFASTDLDALAAIYADVDVMRYYAGVGCPGLWPLGRHAAG